LVSTSIQGSAGIISIPINPNPQRQTQQNMNIPPNFYIKVHEMQAQELSKAG